MTASTAPAPSMFAVSHKRDFSLLWLAQLVSTVGSSLTALAAGILVYRVTGSALSVGLMLVATAVPSLIVGLLAGVVVDRYLAEEPSTLMEIPASTLRGIMDVPAISSLFTTTLTERLGRTTGADRPRLSGLDQEALLDLRTPRPTVEALPRTYHDEPAVS